MHITLLRAHITYAGHKAEIMQAILHGAANTSDARRDDKNDGKHGIEL